MKKFLVLILTLCMLLGLAAPAALADDAGGIEFFQPGMEYPTGEEEEPEETVNYIQSAGMVSYADVTDMEKIGILGALDILGAYTDNLFKPNVYVSRAEYVEALLKLFAIDYNGSPAVSGKFYDVDENSPYYSVVYTAYAAGIASGYTNNTFCPEQVLSYAEAQIFAVKALGYNDVVAYYGSYPGMFSSLQLDKGLSVKNLQALTRMEMATILYNILNTESMQLTKFNAEGNPVIEKGDTPLFEHHNVAFASGIVTANRITGFDGNGTNGKSIVINGNSYTFADNIVNNYLGCQVKYYYEIDEEEIVFLYKDKKMTEIQISDRDLNKFDFTNRKISYYTGSRDKTVSYKDGAPIFYNGVLLAGNYSLDLFDIHSGSVRLIAFNGDSTYDVVFIEDYDNYVVNSVKTNGDTVQLFFSYDEGMMEIDARETYVEVYAPGGGYFDIYKTTDTGAEKIDVSAIKSGMVASIQADNEGWTQNGSQNRAIKNPKYIKITLSDSVIEGTINSKDMEELELDITAETEKQTLDIAGDNYFEHADSTITLGETVEILLDAAGGAVCLNKGKSEFKYGYIIRTYFNDEDEMLERIKFLTTGSKTVTYAVEKPLRINRTRPKEGAKQKELLTEAASMINPGFEYSQIFKYKTNGDEENPVITEIQLVTASTGVAAGYDSNWLQRDAARGTYSVTPDTKQRIRLTKDIYAAYFKPTYVFNVPKEETTDETKYNAKQITDAPSFEADAFDVVNLTPTVLVRYANVSSEEGVKTQSWTYPLMFDEANPTVNADGEDVLEIKAAGGWEVLTLYSEDMYVCDGLERGDLAYFYEQNDKVIRYEPVVWSMEGDLSGKTVNIRNLPEITSLDNTELSTSGEFSYEYFAEVLSVSGSDFVTQYGPKTKTGEREQKLTGCFMHEAWMHGGVILYQEDGRNVLIRQGTVSDLRPAEIYGNKASRVLCVPIHGAGRQYIIFNPESWD